MSDAAQTIATTLKDARQGAGLSLQEVSAELNIRLRYLEAIEADRFETLPPPAFTAGFVRSYAALLGLDGCVLARQVYERMGDTATAPELRFPEPVAESRLPGRAALLSGLVGLLAIYFGWIHDFSDSPGQAHPSVDSLPERLAGLARDGDDGDTNLRPAGFRVAGDSLSEKVSASPAKAAEAPLAQDRPGLQPSAQPAKTGAGGRIVLTAHEDSWIRVIDAEGRERFSGILRSGESWSPNMSGNPRLNLTTSNAGGLSLAVDGESLAALGETGAVVEDIALEPQRLKNDYTLAMH